MGKMTNQLFQNIGFETVVSDIKNPNSPSPFEVVHGADVIFFSVLPINEIPRIVDAISPVINEQNLILDNASVKEPIRNTLSRLDENGLSVCSTHPLCAANVNLEGEKVLLMNVGTNFLKARLLAENLYSNAGMQIINFDLREHDNRMSISQFIPHFVMRAVESALAKNNLQFKDLQQTATANFNLFLLSLARVGIQDPKISQTIIDNLGKTSFGERFVSDLSDSMESLLISPDIHTNQLFDDESKTQATELTNDVIESLKRRKNGK